MEIVQLRLGGVVLPNGHPRAGSDYPLFGYLLCNDDGPILVDTGAGPGHPAIDSRYELEPVDLPTVLGEAGVAVADVAMIINTHLHFDHIGGNRQFPGVPIVAQQADFAASKTFGFTVPEWVEFDGADLRPVVGVVEVARGVSLMPTPSHTAGHQSVVVRDGGSTTVIAGQAVHNSTELASGVSAEGVAPGEESFGSVAARIKAIQPDQVWFSHDPEPWMR